MINENNLLDEICVITNDISHYNKIRDSVKVLRLEDEDEIVEDINKKEKNSYIKLFDKMSMLQSINRFEDYKILELKTVKSIYDSMYKYFVKQEEMGDYIVANICINMIIELDHLIKNIRKKIIYLKGVEIND